MVYRTFAEIVNQQDLQNNGTKIEQNFGISIAPLIVDYGATVEGEKRFTLILCSRTQNHEALYSVVYSCNASLFTLFKAKQPLQILLQRKLFGVYV